MRDGVDDLGLSTRRFAFEAFLPADKKRAGKVLEELERETRDDDSLRSASSADQDFRIA